MFQKSGGLALALSGGTALVTTLCLSFFKTLDGTALILAFLITFGAAFFTVWLTLKYLVFGELEKTVEVLRKLTATEPPEEAGVSLRSLKEIRDDAAAFAEAKQKEIEQLKKLEAFRKDFIADVSHELKTPIFAAQGFVHTLLDGAVKDKTVRKKFLKKAAKSLDGLDNLVQELLTLSQIETGQIRMRFENIDLYALTDEVFEQFRGKSNRKEVLLRIEGPSRKVMVCADWQRISQVMTNLISNAIKHSETNGEVVVSFVVRKKTVITRVRDAGVGIAPEHINRIFERFYRVDKSRSREKGGTGLGLAIVKHILEGHDSRPEVESEPGKGSTFSFKLPRMRDDNNDETEGARDPAKD